MSLFTCVLLLNIGWLHKVIPRNDVQLLWLNKSSIDPQAHLDQGQLSKTSECTVPLCAHGSMFLNIKQTIHVKVYLHAMTHNFDLMALGQRKPTGARSTSLLLILKLAILRDLPCLLPAQSDWASWDRTSPGNVLPVIHFLSVTFIHRDHSATSKKRNFTQRKRSTSISDDVYETMKQYSIHPCTGDKSRIKCRRFQYLRKCALDAISCDLIKLSSLYPMRKYDFILIDSCFCELTAYR